MSVYEYPIGGSADPIDLSAYVSHRARAARCAEAAESDDCRAASVRPKRARGFSGVAGLTERILRLAQSQAVTWCCADDHAIDTRRSPSRNAPAEHAALAIPYRAKMRRTARLAASPRTPLRAARQRPDHPAPQPAEEQPAAERRDGIMSDGDLERLEASLRWLQRQETATRLPRAGQLPPSPRLAPFDASRRRYGGERCATAIRAPLSLEPERLAPPPCVRAQPERAARHLGGQHPRRRDRSSGIMLRREAGRDRRRLRLDRSWRRSIGSPVAPPPSSRSRQVSSAGDGSRR